MPFSKKYNCFLFHVPKTGGTSIERLLGMDNGQLWGHDKQGMYKQHYAYVDYKNSGIKVTGFDNMFKFIIVRNPYDRMVSEYFWQRKGKFTDLEFTEFIETTFVENVRKFNNNEKGRCFHFSSQSRYVFNGLDYIGRCEDMNASWVHIRNKIGVKQDLPKHNTSKHGSWQDYYTDKTRDIVYNAYKEDFEKLEYSKIIK